MSASADSQSSSPTTKTPHRIRRIVWCGVGLVVVLLLYASVIYWWRADRQEAAVLAMLRFNSAVYAQYAPYKYEPPPPPPPASAPIEDQMKWRFEATRESRFLGYIICDDPPQSIAWLVPVFGNYAFVNVNELYIRDETFRNRDVELILAFPELRKLELNDTSMTGDGLAKLLSLDSLITLELDGKQWTDHELRSLPEFKILRELDLSGTEASDEFIAELREQLPECIINHEYPEASTADGALK